MTDYPANQQPAGYPQNQQPGAYQNQQPNAYQQNAGSPVPPPPAHRSRFAETKAFYKTSEFIAYVVAVLAVLIASALVDNGEDGQGFGAVDAWWFVTVLTAAYMISRGLAKSGVRKGHDDDR